ncbi:acetate kinase [Rhizobium sp. ERR 922]|uniref:Acetate kinase n=1 Tax=Rhizobium dioscoreae TaxID=2653122 RepID=A0ABQ0Z711_9HYPH|nr:MULTISPECIES: acetate/propionate family kinase [Rhizobium]TWB53486.1 acetate kinase [Rhizobium sp. ERR 922]TWB95550.1 acetate kinase [Rhizobium sp. ERR 942]GES51158.1 acetate kinase [Rhizobium dioscoreae]GLU82610.1 acetate kinase [Rhizobium sp. NBRC 114257]
MSDDVLLTFNAGSSTLKIGVFELATEGARNVGRGKIDFDQSPLMLRYSIGTDRYEKTIRGDNGTQFVSVISDTLDHLLAHLPGKLRAVAHRVVHGGMAFQEAVLLDEAAIKRIEKLVPLAPLHQPQALRAIRSMQMLRPDVQQTASFDTAFHSSQADVVRRLAIPRAMHDDGVRRYGFHGLSYKYIAAKLREIDPEAAKGKVVTCHLGSGASLCAMENGTSRDTSMGFSALDGIPMATRPGWLDPGALLYLMRTGKQQPERIEDFLYHQCGLLGVSGISGDTRVLLDDKSPEAAEAIDLFCLRISGEIGRLCATTGGLDAIVFTAGIGENQPEIRTRVARRLQWLGIEIDEDANDSNLTSINAASSRVKLFVIPTDEERVIAEEAVALVA